MAQSIKTSQNRIDDNDMQPYESRPFITVDGKSFLIGIRSSQHILKFPNYSDEKLSKLFNRFSEFYSSFAEGRTEIYLSDRHHLFVIFLSIKWAELVEDKKDIETSFDTLCEDFICYINKGDFSTPFKEEWMHNYYKDYISNNDNLKNIIKTGCLLNFAGWARCNSLERYCIMVISHLLKKMSFEDMSDDVDEKTKIICQSLNDEYMEKLKNIGVEITVDESIEKDPAAAYAKLSKSSEENNACGAMAAVISS